VPVARPTGRGKIAVMRVWIAAAAVVLAGACSKAGDESQARRAPIAPPPPTVHVPADLHIPVTVDGKEVATITAGGLAKVQPDFSDDEHRAWRLVRLVPAFDHDGAVLEARGRAGVSLRLDRPASAAAPQPVLFLTRRGDVMVSVLDPTNPFPGYHGQGGRLRRAGDSQPRIQPVTALAVVDDAKPAP
jgi:hypothetical protein